VNRSEVLLGAILLMWLPAAASAVVVSSLNSAEVEVADQSSRELAAASREALAEVMVKVSGSEDVLANPVIINALGRARDHLQQSGYRTDEERGLLVRFEFDADWVTNLVVEAREPLWTANRPHVLVWLVVEEAGSRQFASAESHSEIISELRTEFERRGVPVKFPLFDLADSASLDASQVWGLEAGALRNASARYGLDHVLAGRLVILSSGEGVGDWSYLYDHGRLDRTVSAVDGRMFVRDGASMVAEAMAARFAVAPTRGGDGDVVLYINGVNSYADYAGIVSSLERLELVEHANVERIRDQRVALRLATRADAEQLAAQIELDSRFQPEPVVNSYGELNYLWQN
jgi:hypothetical protein